jgi:hypothetical protein
MDRESMERLRLDRRLIRRRSWISPQELERELAAIPDAAHKVAVEDEAGPTPKSPEEAEPSAIS